MSPDILTFSSISVVPDTSCWRAITTSSFACSRMVNEVLVSMSASRRGARSRNRRAKYASCRNHLDLGAAGLVLGELECLDRVFERKLARQQRTHVDAARRQVLDRPVEFDAPAKG